MPQQGRLKAVTARCDSDSPSAMLPIRLLPQKHSAAL